MSGEPDLFHEQVPLEFIERVFDTMVRADWHTFQVLTKRANRLAELAPALPWPRNVWMGVSVESERYLDRVERLRSVPAAVRFLSLEPLLGPLPSLDLSDIHWVIVGGESGPSARAMDADWVREVRRKCDARAVPLFFKQAGALLAREWSCSDRNGRDPGEWPEFYPREHPHA
jgi:protein gp37